MEQLTTVGGTSGRSAVYFERLAKTDSKIADRQLSGLRYHEGTDNHSEQNMAETDPKSVQDLTNVVSRDRNPKLALACVA